MERVCSVRILPGYFTSAQHDRFYIIIIILKIRQLCIRAANVGTSYVRTQVGPSRGFGVLPTSGKRGLHCAYHHRTPERNPRWTAARRTTVRRRRRQLPKIKTNPL